LLAAAVDQDQVRATLGERSGDSTTEIAGGAGQHDGSIGEIHDAPRRLAW
jgi:hypothetical protein